MIVCHLPRSRTTKNLLTMVAPSAPSHPHDHETDENTKLRLAELFETIFKHFRTVQATIVLANKLGKPTAKKLARNRQLLDKALLAFGNENKELVSNYLGLTH